MWKLPRPPPPLSSSAVRPNAWRVSRKKLSFSSPLTPGSGQSVSMTSCSFTSWMYSWIGAGTS